MILKKNIKNQFANFSTQKDCVPFYLSKLEELGVTIKDFENDKYFNTFLFEISSEIEEIKEILNSDASLEEIQEKLDCRNPILLPFYYDIKSKMPEDLLEIVDKLNKLVDKDQPKDLYLQFSTEEISKEKLEFLTKFHEIFTFMKQSKESFGLIIITTIATIFEDKDSNLCDIFTKTSEFDFDEILEECINKLLYSLNSSIVLHKKNSLFELSDKERKFFAELLLIFLKELKFIKFQRLTENYIINEIFVNSILQFQKCNELVLPRILKSSHTEKSKLESIEKSLIDKIDNLQSRPYYINKNMLEYLRENFVQVFYFMLKEQNVEPAMIGIEFDNLKDPFHIELDHTLPKAISHVAGFLGGIRMKIKNEVKIEPDSFGNDYFDENEDEEETLIQQLYKNILERNGPNIEILVELITIIFIAELFQDKALYFQYYSTYSGKIRSFTYPLSPSGNLCSKLLLNSTETIENNRLPMSSSETEFFIKLKSHVRHQDYEDSHNTTS